MNNSMETKKKKSKKPVIIFLSIILLVFTLLLILYVVLYNLSKDKFPSTSGSVFLYTPDYDAQIMTEEDYLSKDRSIRYVEGDLSWVIYDEKGTYHTEDVACVFLIEYINDMIRGDAAALKGKYTPELAAGLNIPDRITQQRVYDTVLTRISKAEVVENNILCFRYEFKIEYRIMRNDGTFRSDLASDAVKEQYFTIIVNGDEAQITELVERAVG